MIRPPLHDPERLRHDAQVMRLREALEAVAAEHPADPVHVAWMAAHIERLEAER